MLIRFMGLLLALLVVLASPVYALPLRVQCVEVNHQNGQHLSKTLVVETGSSQTVPGLCPVVVALSGDSNRSGLHGVCTLVANRQTYGPARFTLHDDDGSVHFQYFLDSITVDLTVSMAASQVATVDAMVSCPHCHGSGVCHGCHGDSHPNCKICHGTGNCHTCGGDGHCAACKGSGKVDGHTCIWCNGSGTCQACQGYGTCSYCAGRGTLATCAACGGSGKCWYCHGTGEVAASQR